MDLIDKQSVVEIAMCYCPDDDGICSKADADIRELLDDIENLPVVNILIPCSEQMMPDGAKVLVLLSNGEYFVMTRHGNTMSDGLRHLNDLQSVTHWMPLPEKPEDLNHG